MIQEIAEALAQSWRNFATAFVPVRAAARRGQHHLRRGIRRGARWPAVSPGDSRWECIDRLAARTGASEMLRLADMPSADVLIAKIIFWIVWVGFIVSAVDTLQYRPLQGLVHEFFSFVPRVLLALLVLALGFLVANFVWRATLLATVSAGPPGARVLSGTLRLRLSRLQWSWRSNSWGWRRRSC